MHMDSKPKPIYRVENLFTPIGRYAEEKGNFFRFFSSSRKEHWKIKTKLLSTEVKKLYEWENLIDSTPSILKICKNNFFSSVESSSVFEKNDLWKLIK